MVELTNLLGTGRYVSPRFGLMGTPITLSPSKNGRMIWASAAKQAVKATPNAEVLN